MCSLTSRFLQSTIETGDAVTIQLVDSETPALDLTRLTESGNGYIAGLISEAPYTSVLISLDDILQVIVDSTDPAHV